MKAVKKYQESDVVGEDPMAMNMETPVINDDDKEEEVKEQSFTDEDMQGWLTSGKEGMISHNKGGEETRYQFASDNVKGGGTFTGHTTVNINFDPEAPAVAFDLEDPNSIKGAQDWIMSDEGLQMAFTKRYYNDIDFQKDIKSGKLSNDKNIFNFDGVINLQGITAGSYYKKNKNLKRLIKKKEAA